MRQERDVRTEKLYLPNLKCVAMSHQQSKINPCPCGQVDFQDAEARTVAERRREEERQRRMERIYKERVEAASKDMEGKHHIIQQHYF